MRGGVSECEYAGVQIDITNVRMSGYKMPAQHSIHHACVEQDSNVMEDRPETPGIWKMYRNTHAVGG